MSSDNNSTDGAQNQHYVPKFILRNFLQNEDKERVSVFEKSTGRGFITQIKNIMAERRFHEFAVDDDHYASFEGAAGKMEDLIIGTYSRIVEQGKLDRSDEERSYLGFFLAFQFLRTRASRDKFLELEQQLSDKLCKDGQTLEDISGLGYAPSTEDDLKAQHIDFIQSSIKEFTEIIAGKDFLLMSAPAGRAFYLGDNPVSLHNSLKPRSDFWGNIGLSVKGIELYMPLSSKLMLCAWCPSIIEGLRRTQIQQAKEAKATAFSGVTAGKITMLQMKEYLEYTDRIVTPVTELITNFDSGMPILCDSNNMDFNNSLQMNYARQFVICKNSDFALARKFLDSSSEHDHKGFGSIV